MKPIALAGNPPAETAPLDQQVKWLRGVALETIRNSKVDATTIADIYAVRNLPSTPVRSLDASTATLTEVVDFIGQFLVDLKTRGPNTGT